MKKQPCVSFGQRLWDKKKNPDKMESSLKDWCILSAKQSSLYYPMNLAARDWGSKVYVQCAPMTLTSVQGHWSQQTSADFRDGGHHAKSETSSSQYLNSGQHLFSFTECLLVWLGEDCFVFSGFFFVSNTKLLVISTEKRYKKGLTFVASPNTISRNWKQKNGFSSVLSLTKGKDHSNWQRINWW